MKNDKKTITPNEINKYVYCPYQWYYEREYGNKKLRELYKLRNEEYGYNDSQKSNFKKGIEFHNTYFKKEIELNNTYFKKGNLKRVFTITTLIVLLLLLLFFRVRF